MTDRRSAQVERVTGRSWDEWLTFLAGCGAAQLDHGAIARCVAAEPDAAGSPSPGW